MKIIYLGKELDPILEHELFCDNIYGFDIEIKYSDDSWYPTKDITIQNCTEFHWRYNNVDVDEDKKSVAFESDIFSTGFTRKINTIKSINIYLSDKFHTEYYR